MLSFLYFVCFHRKAVYPHESTDFHDLCVKWRHSVACCAFWGLELYLDPFGGRLPPKTSPKRPSKGKFKPKQKFWKILIISAWIKQFSQNFNNVYLTLAEIDRLSQICKFYKIQDGGGRHLGFRKMLIISSRLKQFSPNFNCIYLVLASIDHLGQIWNFSKIQDGGGRHLGFLRMLIISALMKRF